MSEASEFRSGGRVLAGSFLGISLGVSSLYFYSLGIFIKPLATTFYWSRGESSLGALVGTGCAALAALPTGRLIDRFGSVRVAIVSLLLLSAGFLALGLLTSGIGSFLVIVGAMSLLVNGSSPMSFTRLVVTAFHRRRGLALGLILSGTGVGAILIPALLGPFIAVHGWRAGYILLGCLIPAALPLVVLLLRGAREPVAGERQQPPIGDVLGQPAFIRLGAIFFLASVAVLGTIVQFVPMLTDAGLSPGAAGRTAALIGVSAIGGRVVAGMLLDRFEPGLVTAALFILSALGMALLALGGVAMAGPGALVMGLAIGAEVDFIAFFTGRYFARAVYGQAYGALYGLYLLGGAIGPALSGFLFDLTGTYRVSLLLAAALLTASALLASRIGRLQPAPLVVA